MTPHDASTDPRSEWDEYWSASSPTQRVYERIAKFYRDRIIGPALIHWIKKVHEPGARLLHAGCGSGGVDVEAHDYARITALDFSAEGVRTYGRIHPGFTHLTRADLFALPFAPGSFDGVFNLGVMEHFTEDEILVALREMRRVLVPGGHVILFWPPEWGLSVNVLRVAKVVLSRLQRKTVSFHPPEINRVRSRQQCEKWLEECGFTLEHYSFGPRDVFTHQIIVARAAMYSSLDSRGEHT